WNTICICRLNSFNRSGPELVISSPLKWMVPSLGSTILVIQRPNVDFPHPLSPTSPKISPSLISNETPSTALSVCVCFPSKLRFPVGKCLFKFSTFKTTWLMRIASFAERWTPHDDKLQYASLPLHGAPVILPGKGLFYTHIFLQMDSLSTPHEDRAVPPQSDSAFSSCCPISV